MTIGEFFDLLEDHRNTTTIKNSRHIVAKNNTSVIAENKYLCDEDIESFDFKDGEIIITIYGEESDPCDNCNKLCCYGCEHAEK